MGYILLISVQFSYTHISEKDDESETGTLNYFGLPDTLDRVVMKVYLPK